MLSEFDCDSNLGFFYSTAQNQFQPWKMSGKWTRVWGFLWALGSQLDIDTFWNNLFIPGAWLSLSVELFKLNKEEIEDVRESLLNYLSSDLKFASFIAKNVRK